MIEILAHSELAKRLHENEVRVVYTDLDGTMFAPGGTIVTDNDGRPSTRAIALLGELEKAGIELAICTGRNRSQLNEIAKLLHVQTFIGELGGFCQNGFGKDRHFQFNTGQWASLPDGKTPLQAIQELGIIDRLREMHPGAVEEVRFDLTSAREVTGLFWGNVDTDSAAQEVSLPDFPIDIIDNGSQSYRSENLAVEDVHIYHVLPRGISKGEAIRLDCERRGIAPEQTVALGDSRADLSMAGATGAFCLMGNGCEAPEVKAQIERDGMQVFGVRGHTVDGWCEAVEALLA